MNRTFHGDKQSYYRIPDSQPLVAQLLFLYEMFGGNDAMDWVNFDYSQLRINVGMDDYDHA